SARRSVRRSLRPQAARSGGGPLCEAERAHLLVRHQFRPHREARQRGKSNLGLHLLPARFRAAAARLRRNVYCSPGIGQSTIAGTSMAARLYPAPYRPTEIVDLRRLAARDLEPLLQEEIATWHGDLEWDFEKSADLVRRFVDLRALNGYALLDDG